MRSVLQWTQGRFRERGLSTPRLDAELLIGHALGRDRVGLYTHLDLPLGPEELGAIRGLIRRRLEGESVAYLTGQREFWTLRLQVSPAVLVPRPETETLVEVALALLPGRPHPALPEPPEPPAPVAPGAAQQGATAGGGELTVQYDEPALEEPGASDAQAEVPAAAPPPGLAEAADPPVRIADVGTGSGALALALKQERPAAEVFAVDLSPEALAVARANGERLGLSVTWLEGNLLQPLQGAGPFDLIVSNPPYIPTGELAGLPAEVRCEPRLALDGGPDGLVVIRRLIDGALRLLAPGGALAMEVGAGQADAVAALLRHAGYVQVAIEEDLARIPRVVSGKRAALPT